MHGLKRLLAVICAVLMLAPMESRAATIQTGVGYVQGQCRTLGTSDEKACFNGERWDLGLNFAVKGQDTAKSDGSKGKASASGSKSHDWGGGNWFGGIHGDAAAILVGIIVIVLILYGIYWSIAALASRRISFGLYSTFDFQSARLKSEGEGDVIVEKYHQQSTGLQALFYLMQDTDFVLNVGVAGATAQIQTADAAVGDKSYNLRGISSKAGLGFVPFEETGIYAMLEFEGTYFDGTTLSKYVQANRDGKLPQVHRSGAAILGIAF